MRVPKKLKSFIGKEFNPDELYDAAAWEGIRLCKVFSRATEPLGNNRLHETCSNLSHYYTDFSKFNMTARQWYIRHLIPKEEYKDIYDLMMKANKRLKKTMAEDDVTEETILREMADIANESFEDIAKLTELLMESIEKKFEKFEKKMETERIYPWDHLRFKVEKIKLPDLPEHRYRGPVLNARVENGIIRSLSMTRR